MPTSCHRLTYILAQTNVKAILNHLMDRHSDLIRQLAERSMTFAQLIRRWEQNNEPPPPPDPSTSSTQIDGGAGSGKPAPIGAWAGERALDADEESYFNESDEEEEMGPKPAEARAMGGSTMPSKSGIAAISTPDAAPSGNKGIVRSPAVIFREMREKGKAKLVDYGEDEDEEMSSASDAKTPATTANTASSPAAPLPPPGELKRRRTDEEEDGLGLLGTGIPAAKRPDRAKVGTATTTAAPSSNGTTPKLVISFGKKS